MALARLSGVLAHPTSFPGRYGIGDLGQAAYRFVDFLSSANQKLWQVLPLNPTSFGDSPYQSFSTFAGNHLLISPDTLQEEGILSVEDLSDIPQFSDDAIEYGTVIAWKTDLLRKAYVNFKSSNTAQASTLKADLKKFCDANKAWLDGYCLFVALKSHFIAARKNTFETPEYKGFASQNAQLLSPTQIADYFYGGVWSTWPADIANREKAAVQKWTTQLADEIGFHQFLQFTFYRQWAAIKQYANAKDIKIIGDIPIFVAHDSSDVWCNKECFVLDKSGRPTSVAGVPPDYFSADGQLWGNPLYNWEVHKKQGYAWWIQRIQSMLGLVDILRIDHFRGFESYWAVPYGEKNAVNGRWNKGPGADLFNAIKKALGKLPIIAEDLGIITEEVEQLRDTLNLPGMKVLHFGFGAGAGSLNIPHNFQTSNLVVYSGTHDNDTSMGWYAHADAETQDQFRRYTRSSGEDAAWDMIRLAFLSVANYAIVPVQDVLSLDSSARMNTPGVAVGNWQFRYRAEMLKEEFAAGLAYIAKLADRNIPPAKTPA